MADKYQILGVDRRATQDDIKRAYHKNALENHPDKTGRYDENERLGRHAYYRDAQVAYEVLRDPARRAAYDATLSRAAALRRKRRKQTHRRPQEAPQGGGTAYYNSSKPHGPFVQPEDTHTASNPRVMGATTKDTFRNWSYKIHISKLFNLTRESKRETTRKDGRTVEKELSIRLKLEKSFENLTVDEQATEDICITISDQPGKVERFETYFLERSDATSVLFIILHATVFPGYENHFRLPQPMVLPIDIRLRKNWVPFGAEENIAARATHLLFYAAHLWVPEVEFIEMLEHEEMEDAEMVDIDEECRKMIAVDRNVWKRYAELKFVRKVAVQQIEAAEMMADD